MESLKQTIETLLFITDQPLGMEKLCEVTGCGDREQMAALIAEIQRDYDERQAAFQVLEVADGFQMATRTAFSEYVRRLYAEKMTMRLSSAALETLAIIAYKQPLTRAEIEEIRGVEVIAALETLLEKRLVRVVGRKESIGRPLLYGTTQEFLRHFGLRSLEGLPTLESFAAQAQAAAQEPPAAEPPVVETPAVPSPER